MYSNTYARNISEDKKEIEHRHPVVDFKNWKCEKIFCGNSLDTDKLNVTVWLGVVMHTLQVKRKFKKLRVIM